MFYPIYIYLRARRTPRPTLSEQDLAAPPTNTDDRRASCRIATRTHSAKHSIATRIHSFKHS
jgi:hypothetical protein